MKTSGLVSPEQIAKYDPLYKQAYNSYWTAGDGWKLALRAGTDVEQKKYMEAFSKNFADFQKFVADIVSLVNGIAVKEGGVK